MEQEYLRYKDRFFDYCSLKIAASVACIVAVLLLFFLPLFKWTNELLGLFLEESEMRFSLFDECKLAIEAVKENGSHFLLEDISEEDESAWYPCIFALFFGVLGVIVIVCALMVIWKAHRGLVDIEEFTIEEYDKIRWRKVNSLFTLGGKRFDGHTGSVIVLCVFLAMYAIGLNLIGKKVDNSVSYFTFDKIGVTWMVALFAISVVITMALDIKADNVYRRIRRDVLKKEYENMK